ncbi:MAG TPA: hypothetical protein VGH32_13975 [Pirellulales bacterium]|jgi:hypothetical protein
MPKRKKQSATEPQIRAESQAADAATIGWMLAVLTATVAELGVVAARLYLHWNPDAAGIAKAGNLLMFAAAAIGLVVLGLIPVVYRTRRVKPPNSVTAFAVVVGLLPWLAALAQKLAG